MSFSDPSCSSLVAGLTPLLVVLYVGHEMRTAARDACQHRGLQACRHLARSGYQVELVPLLAHVVAHVTDDLPEHAGDAFGLVECQVNREVFTPVTHATAPSPPRTAVCAVALASPAASPFAPR